MTTESTPGALGSNDQLGPAVEQALYSLVATADDEADDGNRDRAKLLHACAATLGGAMPRWRDMETAPRDRFLLGWVDGAVRLIRYGKTSHVPMFGWNVADQGAEDFDLCTPAAWMPLPAGPNVRANRAATVGRQARAGENVPCTTSPGLVACRCCSG